MKITANKVSAIIFTLVAVTAFSWMTLRPVITQQTTGFALAANTQTNTTAKTPPEDINTSSDTIVEETQEESIDSSTNDDSTEQTQTTSDPINSPIENTDTVNNDKTVEETAPAVSDQPNKQTEIKETSTESAIPKETPVAPTPNESKDENKTEPPIREEAPVTPALDENKGEDQSVEKKKTDTENTSNTKSNTTDIAETTDSAIETKDTGTLEYEKETTTAKSNVDTINVNSTASQIMPLLSVPDVSATQNTAEKTAATESYIQAENARGTVVILHGCDYKADTADNLAHLLQKSLPTQGWNTLLFPLPTLSLSSTYKDLEAIMPEVASRIEKNIAIAKEKSQTPVVLLAHSCGSHMALAWMEVKGNASVDAYIGVGTGIMNTTADDATHLRNPLEKMIFPQLDIFGTADHKSVIRTAPERLSHINRAANPASRQKMILNADHNMTEKSEKLTNVISKWLNKKAFKK